MSFAPPPQPLSLLPESAPFTPEQRAWLNGFFAGLISVEGSAVTPLSPADSAALMAGALAQPKGPARRRRRWRGTLARSDPAVGRAHEARRRPAAAPAPDGRHGATGLRPVRLQLPGLFRGPIAQDRGAAEPVRAGRQGDRPHAQDAVCGVRHAAGRRQGARHRGRRGSGGASRRGASRRGSQGRGRALARQSGDRHLSVPHASQQARIRQGDLARRARPRRIPASSTWWGIPSACFRPTIPPSPMR